MSNNINFGENPSKLRLKAGFHKPESKTDSCERDQICFQLEEFCPKTDNYSNKERTKNIYLKNKNTKAKYSELMKTIFIEKISLYEKTKILFRRLFFHHILAIFFNINVILIQDLVNKSCYLSPECSCNGNIELIIYNIGKNHITHWFFLAYQLHIYVFHLKLLEDLQILKYIFFGLLNIGSILVYSLSSCDEQFLYGMYFIYIEAMILYLLFYIYILFKLNFRIKEGIKHWYQGGILPIMQIFEMAFFLQIMPLLAKYLHSELNNPNIFKNIFQILIMVHSIFFNYISQKFMLLYYKKILKDFTADQISVRITSSLRFVCAHIVASNTAGLLGMDVSDWGAWILIFFYCIFIVESYTKINLIFLFLKRLWSLIRRKGVNCDSKKDKEKKEFEKIYCGCLFDIQIICCFRILCLFFWRRWSNLYPGSYSFYYKNCQYEISDLFTINLSSVCFVISLNIFTVLFTMIYMTKAKKIVFSYRINRELLIDLYTLFALHFYLEYNIQLYSATIFDDKNGLLLLK